MPLRLKVQQNEILCLDGWRVRLSRHVHVDVLDDDTPVEVLYPDGTVKWPRERRGMKPDDGG